MRTSDVGSTPTRGASTRWGASQPPTRESSRRARARKHRRAPPRSRGPPGSRSGHPDEVEDDEGPAPDLRALAHRPRDRRLAGPRPRAPGRRRRQPAGAGRAAHPRAGSRRRARGPGDPGRHGARGPDRGRGAPEGGRSHERHGRRDVRGHPAPRGRDRRGARRRPRRVRSRADDPDRRGRQPVRLRPHRPRLVGRRRRDRGGEGRDPGAGGDQGDQQRDLRVRRGVPRRRGHPDHQRQRQGRVLPDRRGGDRARAKAGPSAPTAPTT